MRKRLLLLFALYTGSFSSHPQQILFKSYTVQDGLVANPVSCIYQDRQGFIWVGTFEGLSRYDGYKFTNYTADNGLSHNLINSLFEVNDTLLVAENNGAVDVIQNSRVQKGFMAASAVNYMKPYKNRLLLTTDSSGFYEYKNGRIVRPSQQSVGMTLGHFTGFNDSLLISDGIDNNLFVFKNDLSLFSVLKGTNIYFYSLLQDSKKRVWACTSVGLRLLQLDVKSAQPVLLTYPHFPFNLPSLSNSAVTAMIEENDGSFWVGTNNGLIQLFSDGRFQTYSERDGLPSAIINTIYRDREQNLWIGTASGLAKWAPRNEVVFYNAENKEFKNDIISVNLLANKNILLNTGHGLQQFYFETKQFKNVKTVPHQNWVPVHGTSPVLVHYDNQIGTFNEFENTIKPLYNLDTVVPGVFCAYGHPSKTILLGAAKGLFAVKNSSVKKLMPHRITSLLVDQNNYLWVGTWKNGLFRVWINSDDGISYVVEDFTSLVGNHEIRSLYKDNKKNIWVGTRYGGAFRLTPKNDKSFEILRFGRQSGIMSDWIKSFAEAENGDMWIGTYLGIDRLVKEPGGYRVFNFSKATNLFAQIESIVSVGNNNWVCVANTGIAYFKDQSIHKTLPLQASILSAAFGTLENKHTVILPKEKIFLKPNQNAARFEFSALGFINEKQVMYSYRLKGTQDTSWSSPENIHEAIYISLAPGLYTFEVKTIGWNGKDGRPAGFSFFINTPYWQTWWFYLLISLVVLVAFYVLYRYRISQLLRLQKVRNTIASDLHDDIGSTLTNISILSELTSKNLAHPEKAEPFLSRISEEVQASSQAMDDIIWSVNSRNDSLQETMARMRRYAAELFDNSDVNCHLQLDDSAGHKKLSMEQRRDVYLIYKEALNNIHKHADADNVWIEVALHQNHLNMRIKDDGKGFNTALPTHRNGLKNLRSRVEKWQGKIQVESQTNMGTAIEIKLALKE